MRIRSKLVLLIAVPLAVLTLVAAVGFSNQSVVIETAEEAKEAVGEAQAVQDAVLAIGNERLLTVAGDTDGVAEAVRVTDRALAALSEAATVDSGAAGATVAAGSLVESARGSDSEVVGLYGEAISGLLGLEIDAAANYPNAQARNTALVNQRAVEALQLREWAWIAYIQLDARRTLDPDSVSSVVADFAAADTVLRSTVELADSGGLDRFATVLQSGNAAALQRLEVEALDDLNEGDLTVPAREALSALVDYRAQWSEAILAQGQLLRADVADELRSANDLRSLFTLLAVVGSMVLAGLIFVMYRSITNPLESLLDRASAVADVELPQLMNALRHADGSESLPTAEPIPVTTTDEIGELVEAFNNVQTTAYDLATEQALSRRNVADMFVNLGRRNQQLLQRILGQLTQLEQHEEDPDKLAELFELDNIVTRMRRNAESLLALAGAQTARQWSQPIEMEHTIRAAFGEVEGYERIDVATLADTKVTGRVVADITHLLAELLENALNFSDSQSSVEVNGQVANDGYLITIRDLGIGMSLNELAENNQRITDPPPLDQVPTRFLGLYVVGRLAERHGIEVRLSEGEIQGTVARVVLPPAILVDEAAATPPEVEILPDPITGDELDTGWDETYATEATDELAAHEPVSDSADSWTNRQRAARIADYQQANAEPAAVEPLDAEESSVEHAAVEQPVAEVPAPLESRVPDEQRSPLEEVHDLEAELAALTADESDDNGASAPLPTRSRGSGPTQSVPAEAATDASAQTEPPSDWVGLPVRQRGNSLEETALPEVPTASVERRAPTETSPDAANNFSSMLSAFSSGINQGLEDAEDEDLTKGEDR